MGSHQQNRSCRAGRASSVSTGNEARARRHAALVAALAALLGAAPLAASAAPPERSAEGPWIKGRILVMPKPGLSSDALAKILRVHGGKAKKVGGSNLHIIDLPPQASEKAVAAVLARNPHLEFAELDELVPPDLATNDPYMGSAWHLSKIGAPTAWDMSQGSGVTIAILDSGVDAAHPDLSARIVPGWNFYDNNSDTSDVFGHGTKVAGAAAAITNNGVGVSSVAGQARIMPIRVTNTSGTSTLSSMAQGITYAADHGARVANLSFAAAGALSVQSAAQYMKDKGGLVFVSAGNQNTDPGYAAMSSLIAVSATDSGDNRASFSNYGGFVALAGPGVSIYSTTKGGGYGAVSGTSFSSPVCAAVAALVMAVKPSLSSTAVEQILFTTATDLGVAGRDPIYGHGRIDANMSVQAALSGTAIADSQSPSASISAPLAAATVSGLLTVDVSATDNVGIVRVVLLINGTELATDSSAPFAFSWDSTQVANGTVHLAAAAYDSAGNISISPSVPVTVSNLAETVKASPISDTVPPQIAITNPSDGSKVKGNMRIHVIASDDSGESGLRQSLYIDGVMVLASSGSTLTYSWAARSVRAGPHTIKAVASDAAGNLSQSTVTVYK